MSTSEHFHSYIQSTANPIAFYCKVCGSFSFLNTSSIKPSTFKVPVHIDPLSTFSLVLSLERPPPKASIIYTKFRINGINMIKYLSTTFDLDEKIYHSSIYLMDMLYIDKKFTDDIPTIAISCVILIVKFNENFDKAMSIQNSIINMSNRHNEDNNFYKRMEMRILAAIDYNLSFYTADDILSLLLYNGVVFDDEDKSKIEKIYLTSLLQLNGLIEKSFFVNFSPLQMAFSVVFLIRSVFGMEIRKDIFTALYGYPFESFESCYKFLKSKMRIEKTKSRTPSSSNKKSTTKTEKI